ncbi:crosslink repair DNA glycosylase YcaQ family protein [Microbacterium sp. C7(2022)]|uniref:DNA glycosylase AlkZ-like family protein n=1 Tax=Microbacterium sp. C7(2022) TaxID=2992759 RepID=UPI00237B9F61|nr:crosslink repair DNA glycosylase YcaQ family protein [Microbacterium sp. C7(2022)]MDE0546624.1 winged helix DNA-binding domain-containing protein [Microbacterium sp. C7(2022)]
MVRTLSRRDARRIAVRAQQLDARRPGDVVEVVEQLTLLNIDPTAAVMPCEHHLLWSRIGEPYDTGMLTAAAERDRAVFEFEGAYRAMSDLPLFAAEMRAWPRYEKPRDWLAANPQFRQDILDRLAAEGELPTSHIADTAQVPWPSSGWTNNRNVTQMLEILLARGEVAIAGRDGRERRWDLAERVYPPDIPEIPLDEARTLRDERRLSSLGIARAKAVAVPIERTDVGRAGVTVSVESVSGRWQVDAAALALLDEPFEPRTVLLSPFDRLVFDRARARELFEFDYLLEMYKPKSARKWGYFALPILHGDELIGKLDAAADRKAGVFRVAAIHEDRVFDDEVRAAVNSEIRDLATWLGLEPQGIEE